MTPGRFLSALGLVTVVAVGVVACGEPTAQVIQPEAGRISFEVPADYVDIGAANDSPPGQAFGLPSSPVDELSGDPVVLVGADSGGTAASFASLRSLSTFNEFDPLDEAAVPASVRVLDYSEILESEVWGIRLLLTSGATALDFQALVDRRSGDVVVTRVVCTIACFRRDATLIDEIQQSWNLEE